ncbi:Intraflagellar transport protein 88 [Nymphon striatum]|nr:Intraflagellar transport protein 88 [Nymphon striatum]
MQNVHLAPNDDDDIYSGYNEYHPTLQTQNLEEDAGFQEAVRTSYGKRPAFRSGIGTANKPGYSGLGTGRANTGAQDVQGLARPMTAVRGAGYTSSGTRTATSPFDPLNLATQYSSSPLFDAKEEKPADQIQQLEVKVHRLIEESNIAAKKGDNKTALEKARDGAAKERQLFKMKEKQDNPQNWDLTYSVLLNLALQYTANEMHSEALNTYQMIINNRNMNNSGRLKVNIGNIYFKQGNYKKALNHYRKAYDSINRNDTYKEMRMKIMHNIGLVCVIKGEYNEAITSFAYIMDTTPDFKTGLHLLLCYYAIGDKKEMQTAFKKLLEIPIETDDDDKYSVQTDDRQMNLIIDAIKNDSLQQIEKKRKQQGENCILTAAKLIAPVICENFTAGYDWCVEQIRISANSDLANDLLINKAVTFLRQKQFSLAIDTLTLFEKKETKVASTAATNLSFLYLLQGDLELAEKYADKAILADRFNPGGLVNKGNCCYLQGDVEKAREFYKEAISNESSCIEAIYNLGLANKKLGLLSEAMECFIKLQTMIGNNPQIVCQIANLHELQGDKDQAMEIYSQVTSIVPTDPNLLAKIGEMFDENDDRIQAYHYHYDSFRYFPSNVEVIQWLGAYFIESSQSQQAISYFERAAILQPNEVKWQLMIATCQRRSGNVQEALQTYKNTNRKFPDNIECLNTLIKMCNDMGLKEADDYMLKLKKAEKAQAMKEQRTNSAGRPGSRRSSGKLSRNSSASSSKHECTYGKPTARDQILEDHMAHIQAGGRNTAMILPESNEPYEISNREIDASYSDPLGPQMERPRTAARRKDIEDEFENEELGDDLLPE